MTHEIKPTAIPSVEFCDLAEFATNQRAVELNNNGFPKTMENTIAIEIAKYLDLKFPSEFIVWSQKTHKIDFVPSSNVFIYGDAINHQVRTEMLQRKHDIVIEHIQTGIKHIFELKHQTGGGTAIDSVNNYATDKLALMKWAKRNNTPYSLIVADFVKLGSYPRSKLLKDSTNWNHDCYFINSWYKFAEYYASVNQAKVMLLSPGATIENLHSFLATIIEDMNVSRSN